MDRIEHEIDEMENENWIHNVNNDDLFENYHFDISVNDELNLQQLFQHNFYEEINNESDQMSDYLERLPAGGSQSWSSRSMRERQERHFIGYRRHSYPNIARDFVYQQIDDQSSDDEINSLSNLLRIGLTTRDESPPANVASDPRELPMQQQQQQGSNYRWLLGSARNRSQYGNNRSVFSEQRRPVRSRHRIRRGTRRYRMPRSLSRMSRISAKRRRSLSLISRRNNIEYSSESDEEPMEQINRTIERNYPIGSRRNIRHMRIGRRRLSRPRNPHRRQRSSQPRSRLYGRLRYVNSGRIKRRF
uniref:Uncharacterized protein n=1 Tax=Wuchereria bancrofti TaxID=6293 RepID=A0A1I8ET02_WUCBA